MWRQWLSEVEADRLAQRKTREEKQKWNSDNAATPPVETFCLVFDGVTDSYKGIKYRASTVPSRLKSTDN